MRVPVHEVANELRRRLGDIDAEKLHKLLYYVQGWHLAHTEGPLFKEPIEAGPNGPVVADLVAEAKRERGTPSPVALTDAALATIEYVVDRYGVFSGPELTRMTRDEDPWREASLTEGASTPQLRDHR